jgi:hypothetical protein
MVTSPEAVVTIKVSDFSVSTLRVLLSSNSEGTFRTSNGLLVGNPPFAAKKITAPIPRHTNPSAVTKRIITMGLFIFVLLVYEVPQDYVTEILVLAYEAIQKLTYLCSRKMFSLDRRLRKSFRSRWSVGGDVRRIETTNNKVALLMVVSICPSYRSGLFDHRYNE